MLFVQLSFIFQRNKILIKKWGRVQGLEVMVILRFEQSEC